MNSYHLVHKDGDWKLEAKGASRATKTFANCTKREAVKQSAQTLRGSGNDASLRIHGLDGRIQEERTYHANSDVRRASSTRSNTSGPRKSSSSSRTNASHSTRSSGSGKSHTGGPRSGRH